MLNGGHDTRHNDIHNKDNKHNDIQKHDTQHNHKNATLSISVHDIVMLSVANKLIDVERLGDLVAILKTSLWRHDIHPNDTQHHELSPFMLFHSA